MSAFVVTLCLTLGSVAALSDIVFSPCNWDLYDHVAMEWNSILPNTPLPDLECAQIEVPLDWSTYNDPSEESDGTYFVRRLSYKNYRADVSNATAQFWLFTGGPGITLTTVHHQMSASILSFSLLCLALCQVNPYVIYPNFKYHIYYICISIIGQDGSEYEVSAAKMAALSLTDDPAYFHLKGLDYYIPDHRGTGKSTYLGCPNQTSEESPGGIYLLDEETIPCLTHLLNTWGPRLSLFSTSNAARDARYVMKSMTVLAGDANTFKNIIYGGSYGTLLCNRILQMEAIETEPQLGRGQLVYKAILDGVVAPDMYHVHTQLYSGTAIAQLILSACASTTACSDFLGADPIQFVFDLLDDVAAGWCSEFNVTTDDIKYSFGGYPSLTNSIISPVMLVNRLRECNPVDAEDVRFYIDYLHAAILPAYQEGFKPPAGSFPLLYNVMFGEQSTVSAPVVDAPPFLRSYGLESDKQQLGLLYDHMLVLNPQAMWPRYVDPYSSQYPTNITAEILILHGGADSNTPIAYAFNVFNRLSDIAHTANEGRIALPKILTYTPAGHVILFKAPRYTAVKCVSYFLNSATNPALDSCLPLDSIQELFENPPAVDMYLFQYPDYVFTDKHTISVSTVDTSSDCDCVSNEDSLTQGSLIAFFSVVTLVVFVITFWFLIVGPALGSSSGGTEGSTTGESTAGVSNGSDSDRHQVKNPLSLNSKVPGGSL